MSQTGSIYGGPVRRSARLSQPRSIASQSVVTTSAAPTSATPSRRKGPLPKVKSRQSSAYGASGRLGAAEELAVTTTGFAQAFEAQRGNAVNRDDEEPLMSGALNDNLSAAPSLADYESEDPSSSENEQDQSGADTSKSFGMARESGMVRSFTTPRQPLMTQAPRQEFTPEDLNSSIDELIEESRREVESRELRSRIRTTQSQASRSQANAGTHDQSHLPTHAEVPQIARPAIGRSQPVRPQAQPFAEQPIRPGARPTTEQPVRRILPDILDYLEGVLAWPRLRYLIGAILLIPVAFMLRTYVPSPGPLTGAPSSLSFFNALRLRVADEGHKWTEWIMPSAPARADADHGSRGAAYYDNDSLWTRIRYLNTEFDEKIGAVDAAIQNLKSGLPEQLVVIRHKDGSIRIPDDFWNALLHKARSDDAAWNEFLKASQLKLKELRGSIDIGNAESWPMLVAREEFAALMEKQYAQLADHVDTKIAEAMSANAQQFKSIMQKEARKAAADQIRLQSLAMTNLVASAELTTMKVNYFSPGLGARVESSLTSATFSDHPAFLARFLRRLAFVPERRPPAAALDRWEEPGECWCAAVDESGSGKAQLTVRVPKAMYPNQITVEHLPMAAAPDGDISNAPRDVEVWVQTTEPPTFHFQHRRGQCSPGPTGWSCLGRFRYDIHGSNHVQTFNLDGQSAVPITKTMVRVVTNWGANHTCIYRLRLFGHNPEPAHVYNVRD